MKIQIFDLSFDVVELLDGDLSLGGNLGFFDLEKSQIGVCRDLPVDLYFNVLVHETVHGVLTAIGVEDEEETVNRITTIVATLLKQNASQVISLLAKTTK